MIFFLNILLHLLLFPAKENETTLYGTEILRGKVASIVTTNNWRCDSIVFTYNNTGPTTGYTIFEDGKITGYCEYIYFKNCIEQNLYNSNRKLQSRYCIEYDNNSNIIKIQEYGFIYPDTTNTKLLYEKSILYNAENKKASAYEYFCDGTPPYKYKYTYSTDGIITEERINANTGTIFTITQTTKDKYGNVVEVSETMPKDSSEWYSATIDYIYDNQGNWTKRKVNGYDPRQMNAVRNCTRKIRYAK